MDVYFQSEIGMCGDFSLDGKKKEQVSIVISPLRVSSTEEMGTITVVSGCNMWHSCMNVRCFFSEAARRLPKMEPRGHDGEHDTKEIIEESGK